MTDASAAAFGLGSAAAWGAGDFAGGLAAKRAPALRVALVVQVVGALLLATLALALGDALPARGAIFWSAVAGLSGAVGVASLYAALASGRMGIGAPLSGLVAAVLPVAFGIAVEGAPRATTAIGFLVALGGVTLVGTSRAERPPWRVLGLSALAGLGFAGFLLAISFASAASLPWSLTFARLAAGALLLALLLGRTRGAGAWSAIPRVAFAAAILDTLGNALFLLAARAGRLDVAVVLSSLYPAATVLLARVVLKERLTRSQALGALLILAAIPLIAW